jgi:hypothetical protein
MTLDNIIDEVTDHPQRMAAVQMAQNGQPASAQSAPATTSTRPQLGASVTPLDRDTAILALLVVQTFLLLILVLDRR